MSPAIVEADSLVVNMLRSGWLVHTYLSARAQSIGDVAAEYENRIVPLRTIQTMSLPLIDMSMGKGKQGDSDMSQGQSLGVM